MGFPCDPAVKNPPANGLRRSLGVGSGNPLVFLPGKFPWREEPGELQSRESQRAGHG